MTNIVLFKPRLGAQENLAAFIATCRNELTIFGADLAFDSMTWDVTAYVHLRGKNGALRAVFSSWETAKDRNPTPMSEPFQAFAKSYFRYQHGFRPTKIIGFRIAALRALNAALMEQGVSDPTATDVRALNRAAQLIRSKFSGSAGYRIGQQLEMLAGFMDVNRLACIALRWSNPIPRPRETAGRVGDEFDAIRQEKLPSPLALDSLAKAFRGATEPFDRVVTAIAAIMCSAPDRVNEVLRLRSECEVHCARPDEPLAYGLRFWPSKGADPMVKWVVPSMSSVVREALSRLHTISSEARKVAGWYEHNPTSIFLPAELEHLRGQDLSMRELGDVLFVEPPPRTTTGAWCTDNEVPTYKQFGKRYVKFVDVERAVIKALPRNFPLLDVETNLRFSEALCIVRRNQLHNTKGTFRCIIEAVDQNSVSTGLGNRSKYGFKSIFDNLNLFEADGSPIIIRTHQFRHYLNTLAVAGGLSELDIAKWSGRKDIHQNDAYNHVSDRDTQARLLEFHREAQAGASNELTPQVRISLISREKFKEMGIEVAHTTDFGMCVHDFAMSPCTIHMDCVNCNEQVCIKGDVFGEANARAKHAETQSLLAKAEAAEADGNYGASRWVEHQRLTLARLSELIAILDNPLISQGAVIRLTHFKPASRLEQAVDARNAHGIQTPEPSRLKWSVVKKGN